MKHEKRLAALEAAPAARRGMRYYSTNDDLEAADVFIDCTDEPAGYRAALAPACETIQSIDDLDEARRARIVSRDRITQDEQAGYQCFIIRYTRKWQPTAQQAF